MKHDLKIILGVFVLIAVFAGSAQAAAVLQKKFNAQETGFNQKISLLQKQISGLQEQLKVATGQNVNIAPPQKEIINREVIREKSQDELVTAAVAKVTPTVVSVVIAKDVPQLEIVYSNPFGNDPFFKDFNIRVPTYRQKGTVRQKVGAGTGFLITADGYILTNKHVVADDQADYTVLLSSGQQKPAKVIYKDFSNDIAIIKIDGSGYSKVDLGDSAQLKLGQSVLAIGNALGEYNNSVSVGIISGLNRNIQATGQSGTEQLSGVIQTDAAINPGNSGGPLINLDGQVVGINVATVSGSNSISFSIPVNAVKDIIKTVIK